jgi:dipeptidyl aminopeptidase/acylaminoacyl peptidase
LIEEGIVDGRRVAISGFSRNGYFAYYALSHSQFPFAAAVVADNFDASYIQTVLGDNYTDAEAAIGAPAFGAGLRTWLERATGFNAEAIHTPLLLIGQSSGALENILQQWEVLSRLRRLRRPVEMYLMPDIDAHPAHNMQNPGQVIAVQERTVDWFDFWLNEHEMATTGKATQYEQWRELRRLQSVVAGTTRSR